MQSSGPAPLEQVLTRLEGVKKQGAGYTALCPAHDDRENSLTVATGTKHQDGRVLIHCHACCDSAQVLDALGLEFIDLFPRTSSAPPIVDVAAEYEYRDAEGRLLYVVERRVPKKFLHRRPDGLDGWLWNMEGVERVPYRLPEVIQAVREKRWVLVVEGEKDSKTAKREGFPIATCNSGGAGKWQPEFSKWFEGAHVAVIRDNDDAGRQHGEQVIDHLRGVAATLKSVDLPGVGEHGDLTDWVATCGGNREALAELVKAAPNRAVGGVSARSVGGPTLRRASDVSARSVEWLWHPRIPLRKLTLLAGDPGQGKSYVSLSIATAISLGAQIADGASGTSSSIPGDVILIQYEDDPEDTTVPRLTTMGADLNRIHFLSWARPDGTARHFSAADLPALNTLLGRHPAKLVVVDPITSMTAMVNANADGDVRTALQPLVDLAANHGAAVLGLIHLNKTETSGSVLGRLMGSMAFAALARSVLLAGEEEETGRRAVAHVKSNLARLAYPLEYRIGGEQGFAWLGEAPDLDARSLLTKPKKRRDER